MALREHEPGARLPDPIGRTANRPAWSVPHRAPDSSPSVVIIVRDETDLGQGRE